MADQRDLACRWVDLDLGKLAATEDRSGPRSIVRRRAVARRGSRRRALPQTGRSAGRCRGTGSDHLRTTESSRSGARSCPDRARSAPSQLRRSSPRELRGEENNCRGVNHFTCGAASSADAVSVSRILKMSVQDTTHISWRDNDATRSRRFSVYTVEVRNVGQETGVAGGCRAFVFASRRPRGCAESDELGARRRHRARVRAQSPGAQPRDRPRHDAERPRLAATADRRRGARDRVPEPVPGGAASE